MAPALALGNHHHHPDLAEGHRKEHPEEATDEEKKAPTRELGQPHPHLWRAPERKLKAATGEFSCLLARDDVCANQDVDQEEEEWVASPEVAPHSRFHQVERRMLA